MVHALRGSTGLWQQIAEVYLCITIRLPRQKALYGAGRGKVARVVLSMYLMIPDGDGDKHDLDGNFRGPFVVCP